MILDEIIKWINIDSKIILFIRHGEKSEDGQCLSDKGIKQTQFFAKKINGLNLPIKLFSSPEMRCIQTAKIIASECLNVYGEIVLSNKLGKPGMHIQNIDEYNILYKKYKAREIYNLWKHGYGKKILTSKTALKKKAMDLFVSNAKKGTLSIFISQSGTVAGIGYALDLKDYNIQSGEWVEYLEGFCLCM